MFQRLFAASALFAGASLVQAQVVQLSVNEYQELKAAGALPPSFHVEYSTLPQAPVKQSSREKETHGGQPKKGGGQTNGFCNCWIEPDNTYQNAMGPNDDGSSGIIVLPFNFNLYGEQYNTCYINNNGNVSFVSPYGTYTASGFPSADYKMAAPFWADVDTRGDDGLGLNGGVVQYLVTNTALYVNWVNVGYFPSKTDKHNTFQLIITDGTDPVIGVGNNVSFCYKDMQWTTGSASCFGGSENPCTYNGQQYSCNDTQGLGWGFCGSPSTVGANRGNGTDFIQFTRNDHPGNDYDGPFGGPDGVDWLDSKNFRFTTAVTTQNIPPIVSSNFLCDTVEVCMGELVDFYLSFLTPEGDQLIIDASASAPTLPPFDYTVNNNGTSASIHVQFIPTISDTGFHTVTFFGQDNGADSLISQASIVLAVYYTPAVPPTITGDTIACEDQGVVLVASPGYEDYIWTNGYFGRTVLVGPGTYICVATSGNCRLASNIVTITGAPNPDPTIEGAFAACGGQPQTLSTDQPYTSYLWSNGSQDPTISVGTGVYSVTVTDANGCEGTAPSVTVSAPNNPDAMIDSNVGNPIFPVTPVIYTDSSNANGTTIVSWHWTIDTLFSGNGQSIAYLFTTPGDYTVTLTVTTSDGCTDSYSFVQHVIPTEIVVPNVFSPNNDGKNDFLEFENAQYYRNNQLKVFNRWGMEVFASSNYVNDWAGKDMPEGTYYFVFKMESGKEYTGHVTLLR